MGGATGLSEILTPPVRKIEREASMVKRGMGWAALGLAVLAGRAYPLEVQVYLDQGGRAATLRVVHAPAREPLAALRFQMRIKEAAGIRAVTVAKPETGPWSQFLPRAVLEGRTISTLAMAPATGAGSDSFPRPIAQFELSLEPRADLAAASDLIDSTLVLEAYGPDGKPMPLQVRYAKYTAGLRPGRAAKASPAFRQRGDARTLAFNLGRAQRVRAWISDMKGRRVADVIDRKLPAGIQEVTWDGRASGGGVPSRGTYLFHLEAGTFGYDRKVEVGP